MNLLQVQKPDLSVVSCFSWDILLVSEVLHSGSVSPFNLGYLLIATDSMRVGTHRWTMAVSEKWSFGDQLYSENVVPVTTEAVKKTMQVLTKILSKEHETDKLK